MQILFDLLPVLAFYAAYKLAGIFVATGVLMVGVLLLTAYKWMQTRKVSPLMLSSAGLALVFGSLTLLIHDTAFIRWKPTIFYWSLAAVFALSYLWKPPLLIQRVMGEGLQLERRDWSHLNLMWIAFSLLAGALNLYVAFNFQESTWVDFKLFGLMGLTVVFALLQGIWLSRRIEQEQ